ncbi:MAG: acyl-CoA dehydratase activase [Dehalococcoidia bacterium]|nr:acyl-CoA dehydratase activase [Dehalococcoidia bacterium]
MIVAGCDVGSLTGKAVIMKDSKIVSSAIMLRTVKPEDTARIILDQALTKAKMKREDIEYLVGTGYGRTKIPFANTNISEITCHGKGAHWLVPSIRTILDIGGQDSKVISLDSEGFVADFVMNDKCAAGTGRFLEGVAKALEIKLEELGPVSLKAHAPSQISSQCSVFAESEVVTLLADGVDIADIVAGIHKAIASRLISMVKKVGVKKDFTVTGGVAKNVGVVKFLEEGLGEKVMHLPEDPQLVGAIGAAILAQEKLTKSRA